MIRNNFKTCFLTLYVLYIVEAKDNIESSTTIDINSIITELAAEYEYTSKYTPEQITLFEKIWNKISNNELNSVKRLDAIRPLAIELAKAQSKIPNNSILKSDDDLWNDQKQIYANFIMINDRFLQLLNSHKDKAERELIRTLEEKIQRISLNMARKNESVEIVKEEFQTTMSAYERVVIKWYSMKGGHAEVEKESDGPRCPDGFTFVHKSCYTKLKDMETYTNAARKCEQMHESAHLPIFKDKEENDIIVSKYGMFMLIGIRRANGNKFIDEKGHEPKFFNWYAPEEPNNVDGTEDCVEINWRSGKWNDFACDFRETKVVCQVDPIISLKSGRSNGAESSQIESEETSHCPMNFELISGSCYSKIDDKVGHDEAEAACTKLHKSSHLAVFKNKKENSAVSERFDHQFWLGLTRKTPGSDKFVSPNGREATFLNFSSGEPNNANGKEDCVEVYGINGKYNDISCDRKTFPLCQTEPIICPRGFEFFHNSCYKKIHKFMNQPDSVKACKSIHNSSHLPVFNDKNEADAVTEKFGEFLWLGIVRENATSKIFVDENGNVAKYFNWEPPHEPNNVNGQEACVQIFDYTYTRGLMNDINCLTKESFPLCQVDPIPISKYEA